MLPMLRPSQGAGLPTLSYPVKHSDSIGDVTYALSAPSQSHLLADGSSVKAASYPELARKWGQAPGYNNRKLADPATLPTASVAAYCAAVSPDGLYAAVAANGNSAVYVYQITDAGLIYLQTLNLNGGASGTMAGPEAMAFSADSSYLACGNDQAPYLYIFRRAPGSTTFTNSALTFSGAGVPSSPSAIEFTEDNALFCGIAAGGAAIFLVSGNVATRGPSLPGSLASGPLQIVRNREASKFAIRCTSAPHLYFFDYQGNGVFAATTGTLPTVPTGSLVQGICLSPSADYFMAFIGGSYPTGYQYWKRNSAGAYAQKGVIEGSDVFSSFPSDERQFWIGNGGAGARMYQPANGIFLELARGATIGSFMTASVRKSARNGRASLLLGPNSPYIAVYMDGPLMPDIPLPAYPTIGSGGSVLKPYIKVK